MLLLADAAAAAAGANAKHPRIAHFTAINHDAVRGVTYVDADTFLSPSNLTHNFISVCHGTAVSAAPCAYVPGDQKLLEAKLIYFELKSAECPVLYAM